MRNRLRLYSGLILFVFVTGHFLNHSLGLISLDLMNRGAAIFVVPWQSWLGSKILYGAFFVHAGVALLSLLRRRTLQMPAWEAIQLIAGLVAPLILAAHVAGTRGLAGDTNFLPDYGTVLNVYWNRVPWRGVLQAVALCVVWIHSCVGLHHWLRIYPLYRRFDSIAFSFLLIHESPLTDALFLLVSKSDEVTTT